MNLDELKKLPPPQVIEELDFEALVEENTARLQARYEEAGMEWIPHPADDQTLLVEAFSYKEMLLRQRINEAVQSLLLAFAKDADLDHRVAFWGLARLRGANPYARYRFHLSAPQSQPITIPAGTLLSTREANGQGEARCGRLREDVVFAAGASQAEGVVELLEFVAHSPVRLEILNQPIPYVARVEGLEDFRGGSARENDAELIQRILLSLSRFSTAGSEKSYIFHTRSADERIDDVQVLSPTPGVVQVYLAALQVDEIMLERVREKLADPRILPLTDQVQVQAAEVLSIALQGRIALKDLSQQGHLLPQIRSELQTPFKIGERLIHSALIKKSHLPSVARVEISQPSGDQIPESHQVIRIESVHLEFYRF